MRYVLYIIKCNKKINYTFFSPPIKEYKQFCRIICFKNSCSVLFLIYSSVPKLCFCMAVYEKSIFTVWFAHISIKYYFII